VSWRVVVYRLPSEPSRHRVAVWRELRKVGAVSLQQATWAVPSGPDFDAALARAADVAERADGQALAFMLADDDPGIATLERLHIEDREAQWVEFLSECDKFEAELAHEVAIEKFTLAELDEEEQNLDRLRRWYRELRTRDLFGAPSAARAEQRLKACVESLEQFAEQVYEARERP
jgi:hypothetical protein